jgi:hypothetical protein
MNETIEYLRKYNEWRRGADTEQPDPKELGEQIDAAISALVILERERDEAREMVEKFTEQGLTLMDSNRILKREREEWKQIAQLRAHKAEAELDRIKK